MTTSDLQTFDYALGFIRSDIRDPITNKRTRVEYLNIGNNVEIDTMGYIINASHIFCTLHVRDVQEFHPNSVVDVLKQVRSFIIARTSNEQYSKPYAEAMSELPESERLQVTTLNFDPGFTGHVETEERKGGIRLSLFGIQYPSTEFAEVAKNLQENISIKKLILDPESVYPMFVLHNVEILNSALAKLKNQQHIKKRMYLMLNHILSGKEKIFVELDGDISHLPFQWYGNKPHIKLDHSLDGAFRVHGEIELYFKGSLHHNDDCGFNVYVKKDLYDKVNVDENHLENFKDTVKLKIGEVFKKANLEIFWTSHVGINIEQK